MNYLDRSRCFNSGRIYWPLMIFMMVFMLVFGYIIQSVLLIIVPGITAWPNSLRAIIGIVLAVIFPISFFWVVAILRFAVLMKKDKTKI